MIEIRDDIFSQISDQRVTAAIFADDAGIIAGTLEARQKADDLGLTLVRMLEEGASVSPKDEVARFTGSPKQIAMAEDLLMGCLAKPSGVATAALKCTTAAEEKIQIVCGSWKKMPVEIKTVLRKAISTGGAAPRICPPPFIYLDKNYVRMLGGIRKSLAAVSNSKFISHKKVVQIKGKQKQIGQEAIEAAKSRSDIIYIDSGSREDITIVSKALRKNDLRQHVKIAFGGNIRVEEIGILKTMDVDILGIGKEIIDAPLLDLKMEVL